MYPMLLHSHSGLRWILLLLLVIAVINNGRKWQSAQPFTDTDRKINLFTMIFAHIQLVIGLILAFQSPKMLVGEGGMNEVTKFFMMEHTTWMIIAVILITVGYSRSKRLVGNASKFKAAFIPFLLALAAILYAIPWPGRGNLGGSWF